MVNPRDARALYMMGLVERAGGSLEEARRNLELAARLMPQDLPTALQLGEIYLMADDPARAADAFRMVLSRDPANVKAQVGLGWSALMSRQPAAAARIWRPMIPLTRDAATLQRMVELYHASGDAIAESEARAALARLRAAR
jgi:cytochrome c-type biogenesis protein CcmH/NrfG